MGCLPPLPRGLRLSVGDAWLPLHSCPPVPAYPASRPCSAPELLCESEIYGSPVDVWAVGCIFAEILGRKVMFKVR